MERKKIVGTPFKTADGIDLGYDINVNFNHSNKPLPTGEDIRIVNAGEQFEKERQESSKYRLTASIKPLIYYPQEFYWLGTLINSTFEFVTGSTSTSQTNPLNMQNYDLPNILTLNGPNPLVSNFEVDNKDNWVGQILYPFENDYTTQYVIPQFNSSLAFSVTPDDARFAIDTGIDKLVYDSINNYMDLMVNGITVEDWFIGSTFIIKEPLEYNQTLFIANQRFVGYPQDGVPFLFSIPVKTEQGWFTALYTAFPHDFEEGEYIFIKPIASTGYGVANNQYDTCDPSLYGFKRVIADKWNSVLNNKGKHYVLIEHKSAYHDEWVTSPAPNSSSWKVLSSQGFIKRVKNYSDNGIINVGPPEPLLNTTFNIVSPTELMITLTVEHNLKKEDDILLTLSEDGTDTTFADQLRPLLYNLSGTYEVVDIVNNFSFTIRSAELNDNIAYYDGQYTFVTLPQATFITIAKLNPYPSEYYLRKGKILTTINEFEVNELPMSNSIFNDPNANVVIEEDVDIRGLTDNLNRPISQLYLSLTKRAGKENYDFTDVESFFAWMFEYSQILVKTGDGLEIESKRCKDSDNLVGYVKDVTGGWMEAYGEFLGDSYIIDFSEYNKATLEEKRAEEIKHRFNTSYRECGNGICDEWLLDTDSFGNWNYYSSNTSDLTLNNSGGAILTSTDAWIGPSATNNSTGNFIAQTFVVSAEYVNQDLYVTFDYTQVTSTGIVKILDPGGSLIIQSVVHPGSWNTINGTAQQGNYSTVFTPSSIGTHTILLGLSNYPAQYTDAGGATITTTTFEGKYNNVQILKFYGTPQYSGWVYDPFQEYKIRDYSEFIETADPKVLGIPSYATFIDGLWYWRDLLDIGYWEDINFTIGVDYPFLNGKHYVDEEKDIVVSITPNQLGGTSGTGPGNTATIIFGCMDINANNYNPFATVPCAADPLQGGPCVPDANGIMQSIITNPLGCCCYYTTNTGTNTGTTGSFTASTVFAVATEGNNYNNYEYGMTNSGYNRCMGRYPFWREGLYWGSTFGNHPLANNDWKVSWDFASVSTGVDTPPARFQTEIGTITYDIVQYQNYGSTSITIGNIENLLNIELGNGGPMYAPLYGNTFGQDQDLFDPNNEFHSPGGAAAGGGTWGSRATSGGATNKLTNWGSTETISYLGNQYVTTNKYFDIGSGVLEFYKFDTSNCNTCFDKGTSTGTNDFLAPRHNWPLLNMDEIAGGGNGNTLAEFTTGNGSTIKVPRMYKQSPFGGTNAGDSGWRLSSRYENGSSTPSSPLASPYDGNDWSSAGLIDRDVTYGSMNTSIAAHRKPSDPDNWRFFYAQCPTTWGCRLSGNFGDNADSGYPGNNSNTGAGTIPSNGFGAWNTDYSAPETDFITFGFAQCKNSESSTSDKCNRYCSCLIPNGGTNGTAQLTNYQYDMTNANMVWNYNWDNEQPSFFEPIIPAGETHWYRFRGRVNIEMGVNHEGFEHYHNTTYDNAGWQFSMNPEYTFTGGPPLTYLNPFWMPNAAGGGIQWLQWSRWIAGEMSQPDAYLDYTRQYAGFWIGVVSETDKVTYIYDPDDGMEGYASSGSGKQSDGPSWNNMDWNLGCGGFKSDGVTPAINKMSYTPCNDYSSGSVSSQCGYTGNGGGNGSDPCDGCASMWNGVNTVFDAGSGSFVAADHHPRYDKLIAQGHYVPSCGEPGSGTDKQRFQKQWSQSFISEGIPLKEGDRVFIFVRTINGAFKTNAIGGTEFANEPSAPGGAIESGYDGTKYLPSYIVGQLTNIT